MLSTQRRMSRRRRLGLLGAAALFAVGCLSPTLPLPPPTDPTVSSTDTQGLVRLTVFLSLVAIGNLAWFKPMWRELLNGFGARARPGGGAPQRAT